MNSIVTGILLMLLGCGVYAYKLSITTKDDEDGASDLILIATAAILFVVGIGMTFMNAATALV
jgi:hypothetical protein